jgi:hypothetical protein
MTRRRLGWALILLGGGVPLVLLPFQDAGDARLGLLYFIANTEMTLVEGDPCPSLADILADRILAEREGRPRPKERECRRPVTLPYRFVFAFGVLACLAGVSTFVLFPPRGGDATR